MRMLSCYPHVCYGGGSSYYFRSLVDELAKSHEVAILIPESDQLKLSLKKYEWRIPFRVMGSSSTYWPDAKQYTSLSDEELKVYSNAMYKGMLKAFKDFKPDIIHCHFLLPSAWAAAELYKRYKVPVVVTSHGADIKTCESDSRYLRVSNSFLPHISRMIGLSPSHCNWIKEVFRINSVPKIEQIPGGVDPKIYSPNLDTNEVEKIFNIRRKTFVLGVGRLERRKGFHILIEAARQIKSTILLVGNGWEMNNLKLQIKTLKLKNVKLLGFLGPEKNHLLKQLYTAASVAVIPSLTREETLCFVGLEALASGTPVVASSVGGLPFILNNGKVGYLVEPRNANQLATSIKLLLENRNEVETLRKLGRDYVIKNFSWGKIAQRYIRLFNSLLLKK